MKWLLNWILRGFADRYHYNVDYLEEMEDNSPGTLFRYLLAAPLGQYHRRAPTELYWAAKLSATQFQDCGPCVRLVNNMALEAGLSGELLGAILTNDTEHMTEEAVLGQRYARAVLEHDAVVLGELGEQIERRWGASTITELALAIAYGAFYPTMKRGLGHARSCEPLLSEIRANGALNSTGETRSAA